MEKMLVRLVSLLAIGLSMAWFWKDGGFEPAVTSLAGLAGLLSSFMGETSRVSDERSQPDPLHSDGSLYWKFRLLFCDEKEVAANYLHALQAELGERIRKADETYYELYEKLLLNPDMFRENPAVAERWRVEVLTKIVLVQMYTLCREQNLLQDTVQAGTTFAPLWRIEKDPKNLIRNLTSGIHQLVRGDEDGFRAYILSLHPDEGAVRKIISLSRISPARLLRLDGDTNDKKRKTLKELIRIKANVVRIPE